MIVTLVFSFNCEGGPLLSIEGGPWECFCATCLTGNPWGFEI